MATTTGTLAVSDDGSIRMQTTAPGGMASVNYPIVQPDGLVWLETRTARLLVAGHGQGLAGQGWQYRDWISDQYTEKPVMSSHDHEANEALLRRLLSNLCGIFTSPEIDEVRALIDAREYGLALETLADIVHEEKKSFPVELVGSVKQLCELMEMDFAEIENKLKPYFGSGEQISWPI